MFEVGRPDAGYDGVQVAGVKIHEPRAAVPLASTAPIDGTWSTIGSTNLRWRSFLHIHDDDAVMLGTAFGSPLRRMFDDARQAPDAVLFPAWRDQSWSLRMKEFFARLWEYWL